MRRPSFLVFITDQQRADHLGCYGNRTLRTPHIDGIAARGVRMMRNHVASPVCMPNRATLLTGQLPSVHGVRHNGIELPLDNVTLPELLRAAGYRTALIGKSHLQNFTPLPAEYGIDACGAPGLTMPPPALRGARRADDDVRHGQERPERWSSGDYRVSTPYYGFDTVELVTRHGDRGGGDYRRWALAREPRLADLQGREHALPAPGYVTREGWRTSVPVEAYSTTFVAERTTEWLAEYARTPDQPFFIWCSFPDPHHPWTPPGRYFGLHRPDEIELDEAYWRNGPIVDLPHLAHYRAQRDARGGAPAHAVTAVHACTRREAQEAIALNYDLLTLVDDAVGRVLESLQALGLARDTVVAYTSDHGDYMGDHQLLLKSQMHFQGLVRTPLIWSDPQAPDVAGAARAALSSATDLAPTVLERAGVAAPEGMQGRTLLPLMAGGDGPRSQLLIEDESHRRLGWLGRRVRLRSLVSARYRLSVYGGLPWGELYDLQDDPLELRNLWNVPEAAAVRAGLMEQLVQEMIDCADASRLPTGFA